jgi:hypothetical protein
MIMSTGQAWPLSLRALSFAISIGVTLGEFALVAIPIGIVTWLAGAAPSTIFEVAGILAAAFSLTISIYGHVRPVRIPRRALNGGRP